MFTSEVPYNLSFDTFDAACFLVFLVLKYVNAPEQDYTVMVGRTVELKLHEIFLTFLLISSIHSLFLSYELCSISCTTNNKMITGFFFIFLLSTLVEIASMFHPKITLVKCVNSPSSDFLFRSIFFPSFLLQLICQPFLKQKRETFFYVPFCNFI